MSIPLQFANVKPLSAAATDTMRCLFFHGPTEDGNIPSKCGRGELCELGYAEHEFGFAWLTRNGIEIAINIFKMDRAKDKWQRERRQRS